MCKWLLARRPTLSPSTTRRSHRLRCHTLQVVLPSGRVIEGDLACLDRQGNLILSNAQEHIAAADAASQAPSSSKSSSKADKQQQQGGATPTPTTTQLGMVLVPKAQQQQVLLRVPSVSHELGGLSLSSGS
jgi:small nuclear ribonucleoprotein (snRNP)-like protein